MNTNGFFDLQINGYAGVDFNQDGLTPEDLHNACQRLETDDVGQILPTIITENVENMCTRLANLVRFRERDELAKRLIAGFHIEGPFLNEEPGYRGAHPPDAIHPTNLDELKRLLDAAGGLTKLVTLAPERDPKYQATTFLAKQDIVVSAGHCNPSIDQLAGAIDAGLTMFTHLGNGCPMQMHRHDNIIQRTLSLADRLWICLIADGAHVPFFALKNYLKVVGVDRCIVVTDAVAPAGLGPGTYQFSRWTVKLGDDMVLRSPDGSHLIGAAITMPQTVRNLVERVGLSREDALRLTSANPRQAIKKN